MPRAPSPPSRRRVVAAGAAVAALVAAVAGAALLAHLGGPAQRPPTPRQPPAPDLATPAPGPSLAVGITEFNPNLVSATARLPQPWARWREALGALHPAVFRLLIDWRKLQLSPDAPANLELASDGCMRTLPPCLAWGGVRAQLRALASRQREGGWQGLAVVTDVPDWAAGPPSPCEPPGATGRSRAPRADALLAYQRLVEDVLALARREGADLRYWSAWNEPNHPAFLTAPCGTTAAEAYAELVRALRGALASVPGRHEVVIGETAGLLRRTRYGTTVPDFIAGLPREVVCSARVWAQHSYIGGPNPVPAVEAALDARGCPRRAAIWITETGVGAAPRSLSAAARVRDDAAGCRRLHARLVSWWSDPRVTLAVQYTLREDDRFPTGLVSTDLTRARPALAEWMAWGGERAPGAAAPAGGCPGA